jgi:hypothetical protein
MYVEIWQLWPERIQNITWQQSKIYCKICLSNAVKISSKHNLDAGIMPSHIVLKVEKRLPNVDQKYFG